MNVMKTVWIALILNNLLLLASGAQAQTTGAPSVSNPALRQELLNSVKQVEMLRERLLKCISELPECDASADRMQKTNEDNAVRLRAIVRQYGWPDSDLVGWDGTLAATVIVLNGDLAFKKEMLPLIRSSYRAGKAQGSSYAVLCDRILVDEGKPQVYGTQSKDEGGAYPIADETNVEKRRAEVGLPSLAEYLDRQKRDNVPKKNDKK